MGNNLAHMLDNFVLQNIDNGQQQATIPPQNERIMATIQIQSSRELSATDILFATVTTCGRTIFCATYAGMTSVEDVFAALRRSTREMMTGSVTVSLRNRTQGWTLRRTVLRQQPRHSQYTEPQMVLSKSETKRHLPEATQLSLF